MSLDFPPNSPAMKWSIKDRDLLEICEAVSGDALREMAEGSYEHVLNPAEVRLLDLIAKVEKRLTSDSRNT